MTAHLGGPQTPAQIARRHERYLADEDGVFRIVDGAAAADAPAVGWVGFWEHEWAGRTVYETGWAVVPEAQGRGVAVAATALALDRARARGGPRWVHAFPNVDNAPSNAICRRLGFTLRGPCDVEYPPGHRMRCHDWCLDLAAEPVPA